ncbi:unnamed protein product [Psylliodes chrysocephalus]|uniref:Thyroglobulin type-1 domain-containing protein n=1 Tax=Psylliodes chrysocephalus TaxID=3402493 RepID=A0A9P0D1M4_9CUCU|nr:unnamed protein product [Psylliodes chrysocephala]
MIVVLVIVGIFGSVFSDENILCTNNFCKDVSCPELSTKCKAQNVTHNGVFLTPPTTCNCCQFCLDNLNEGEECSTGDVSDPVPKEICGPGLFCKTKSQDEFDGVCSRMETDCMNRQNDYDAREAAGTLGTMEVRQECESNGEFVSYKCIPGQTCYCVNEKGNRIFGEADFTSIPDLELKCKCSRDYEDATVVIGRELNPVEHFRCAANGDYENVQCINDQCFCVDAYDGVPTYPDEPTVNITEISNTTLKCYKKQQPWHYQKCELEYIKILNEYNSFKKDGYNMLLGFEYPKCDMDGTYQAVQENITHKFCVDKEGIILKTVDKVANSSIANSMDCKCVRASLITTNEKPDCIENGNYAPIQCRRGSCRCVDSDGNQVCKNVNCEVDEVNKVNLKC